MKVKTIQLRSKTDSDDTSGAYSTAVYRLSRARERGECDRWQVLDRDGIVLAEGP